MRATRQFSLLFRLALLTALAGAPSVALAQNTPLTSELAQEPTPLDLREAVAGALEQNLALVVEQFNRRAARESLVVAEAGFDPTLTINTRNNATESAQVEDQNTSASSESLRSSVSAQQRLSTGATATLATNLNRSERSRPASGVTNFDLSYNSDVSLQLRQPLLYGGGTTVNRAAIVRAELGVTRTDLGYRGRVFDIVRDTELAFYNLALAYDQLAVRQTAVSAAEQLVQENEARQRAGLQTELDVMQARVGPASRHSALIQARQSVLNANDQLLVLLGRQDFGGRIQPTGVTYEPPTGISVASAFALARQNDPDLVSAVLQLDLLELERRIARNQRLPRLDLDGALGYSGLDDNLDGSYSALRTRDSYNWQLGLSLSLPWGLRADRARYRVAEHNYSQQEMRLLQLEQSLLVNVRNAVRAIETSMQSAEIAALSTELSSREYQLEKAKFDSGLSTSRLVVDAQQRENEARVSEIQTRVQLKQNVARLRRLEGTSLEQYQLDIPATE